MDGLGRSGAMTPQGIMPHSIGVPQLSNVLANNIFTVAVRWERE